MWTSLRIYIYKIVDFISGLSGLLYRTGWTSVNGILKEQHLIIRRVLRIQDMNQLIIMLMAVQTMLHMVSQGIEAIVM